MEHTFRRPSGARVNYAPDTGGCTPGYVPAPLPGRKSIGGDGRSQAPGFPSTKHPGGYPMPPPPRFATARIRPCRFRATSGAERVSAQTPRPWICVAVASPGSAALHPELRSRAPAGAEDPQPRRLRISQAPAGATERSQGVEQSENPGSNVLMIRAPAGATERSRGVKRSETPGIQRPHESRPGGAAERSRGLKRSETPGIQRPTDRAPEGRQSVAGGAAKRNPRKKRTVHSRPGGSPERSREPSDAEATSPGSPITRNPGGHPMPPPPRPATAQNVSSLFLLAAT